MSTSAQQTVVAMKKETASVPGQRARPPWQAEQSDRQRKCVHPGGRGHKYRSLVILRSGVLGGSVAKQSMLGPHTGGHGNRLLPILLIALPDHTPVDGHAPQLSAKRRAQSFKLPGAPRPNRLTPGACGLQCRIFFRLSRGQQSRAVANQTLKCNVGSHHKHQRTQGGRRPTKQSRRLAQGRNATTTDSREPQASTYASLAVASEAELEHLTGARACT